MYYPKQEPKRTEYSKIEEDEKRNERDGTSDESLGAVALRTARLHQTTSDLEKAVMLLTEIETRLFGTVALDPGPGESEADPQREREGDLSDLDDALGRLDRIVSISMARANVLGQL